MSWVKNQELETLYVNAAAQGANEVVLSSQLMCEVFVEAKRELNGNCSYIVSPYIVSKFSTVNFMSLVNR
jgi:hypothetical protein